MPPVAAVSILPVTLAVTPPDPTDGWVSATGFQHAMTASAVTVPGAAPILANAVGRESGLTLAATLATAGMPPAAGTATAPTTSAPVGLPTPPAGEPDPAPASDGEPLPQPIAPAPQPSASPKAPTSNGKTIVSPTGIARVGAATPESATSPTSATGARPVRQDKAAPAHKAVASIEPPAEATGPDAPDCEDCPAAAPPPEAMMMPPEAMAAPTLVPPPEAMPTPTLAPAVPLAQTPPQAIATQDPVPEPAPDNRSARAPVGSVPSARPPARVEAATPAETATDFDTMDTASPPLPHKPHDATTPPSPKTEPQTAAPVAANGPATVPVAPPAQPSLVQPDAIPLAPPQPRRPIEAGTARAASIGRDVGVAISRHATRDGASTLTIRLDPVELGRVEVRLQIDSAGKMLATISAEHATALDLLRRDAGMLAQTLSQAGVQADATSFRFDTQPGPGNGANTAGTGNTGGGNAGSGNGERGWAFAAPSRRAGDDADDPRTAPTPARAALLASGRINLVA